MPGKHAPRLIPQQRLLVLLLTIIMTTALAVPPAQFQLPTDADGNPILPDGGVYQGEYHNGRFEGQGQLHWQNGSHYQGEFKNGKMHGEGELTLANGSRYLGSFRQGMFNGHGKLFYTAGEVYEGEFVDGMMHGKGKFTGVNKQLYIGQFAKDHFHGEGTYTSFNGDVYKGQFRLSVASGPGTIHYKNGGVYQGEIKDWSMHGKGEYKASKDVSYQGSFVNGVFSGQGEIRNKDSHYVGEVEDWRMNGKGILTYKDKYEYIGEFKNNLRHGQGILTRKQPRGDKKKVEGWWQFGRYVGKKLPSEDETVSKKPAALDAEHIFYQQTDLLLAALQKLHANRPDVPDLYLLNFGSYGSQQVFSNEVKLSQSLFDRHYGTRDRSLTLVNNPSSVDTIPLASVTNLKRSLQHIGGLMDREEDILFLFLTSHGSSKHELSVSLRGVPLNDLPAKTLATLLKESGIKWKVIVVSACYSGGFIDYLKDDHTLILTSAKSDHLSFGCSDDANLTYFGRAFFKQALLQKNSFKGAFEEARNLIEKWENQQDYDHSQPQIWSTPLIEAKLAQWRRSLPKKTARRRLHGR